MQVVALYIPWEFLCLAVTGFFALVVPVSVLAVVLISRREGSGGRADAERGRDEEGGT